VTDWRYLQTELRIAASPIWIKLRDAFTGRAPLGPLTVALERRTGATWAPFRHRHQLTPAGDLAFVNLGRSADPATTGSFDVRVTVGCAGMIPEALNGDAAITTTVTAWPPDAPATPAQPDVLRFFPGPGYRFPAGTPLLAGRVVDTAGDPVARVRVFSTASVHGVQVTEEVRTDPGGYFRLPLRWSTGATDVKAALGGRNAAITIAVPADLSTTQQMTLT
jgi:hypothetical protein